MGRTKAIAVWVILIALPALHGAEVTGRVRVTKSLTRKKVSLNQVYERSAALPAPSAETGTLAEELARVVVFLEGNLPEPTPANAQINQEKRRFQPEVLAIPAGSTVHFPNSDPVFHNVFSLSKSKAFDLGNYPKGQSRAILFEKPGIVLVHCHLHPNMNAVIVVTPSRYFVQPDETGRFEITGVPPGRYTVVAWHKSAGFFRRKIDIRETNPAVLDFEIPLTEASAR
ncbi:MAG: carboxypeptidase regulatory-like domain-containing protein [Acidobacteriota bacterium]